MYSIAPTAYAIPSGPITSECTVRLAETDGRRWLTTCSCPTGTEACSNPARDLTGTITADDPEHRFVLCEATSAQASTQGRLDFSIGRASVTDPNGTTPGFSLGLLHAITLDGFEPANGCLVTLSEEDGR